MHMSSHKTRLSYHDDIIHGTAKQSIIWTKADSGMSYQERFIIYLPNIVIKLNT